MEDQDQIRPLGNKVLIREDDKADVSPGGIIIPQTAKDGQFSTFATVIASGPGKTVKGVLVPTGVEAGDRIVIPKHHGTEVMYNDRIHRMVDADFIEGVVEG